MWVASHVYMLAYFDNDIISSLLRYIDFTMLYFLQHYMNMTLCSKSLLSRRIFLACSLLQGTRDLLLCNPCTSLRYLSKDSSCLYDMHVLFFIIELLYFSFHFSNRALVARWCHTRIIRSFTQSLYPAQDCGLHLKMQR